MDKGSKSIFFVVLVLILISASLTYHRAFIAKDFETLWDDYEEVSGLGVPVEATDQAPETAAQETEEAQTQ